jgi:hypothetical protein
MAVVPTVAVANSSGDHPVFVKIARAFISRPGASVGCHVSVYLDDGSQRTYIREDIAAALELPVEDRALFVTGSFGEHVDTVESSKVTISLQHVEGSPPVCLSAWTAPRLCPPMKQQKLPALPQSVMHLKPWADSFDGGERHISLIIGADNIWTVCTGEIFKCHGEPAAVGTVLGWVLSGSWDTVTRSESCENVAPSPALFLHDLDVQRFWGLESIGIRDDPNPPEIYPAPVLKEGRYDTLY